MSVNDSLTTVAIVDDRPIVRHGPEDLLTDGRPTLQVVWTGTDLAELLAVDPPATLVLLDLGTSAADPDDVAKLIAKGSIVLVVSAMSQRALIRQMVAAGAVGFVTKTDANEDLLKAVDTVLSGEPWISHDLVAALATESHDEDPGLTEQERKVLTLYARGLKIEAVARRMNISHHTVRTYLKRIREKCARVGRPALTATDLYREALRNGLVDGD
ncbi:MAG: LuxR C-terminal-related transcriptional regulator [Candidatus Nanopelagicales bacterium]